MRVPKQVKFDCFNYKISTCKHLDGGDNFGKYISSKKEIIVDTSYDEQVVRETLLHELLHLILDDTVVVPYDMEEALVRTLSPRILQLFQRNPKLLNFVFNVEDE